MMVRTWLRPGKHGTWSWSLPPVITCPGNTEACEKVCKALRTTFLTERNRERLVRNYALASDPSFPLVIEGEIIEHQIKAVRVHPSGDFFSYCYTQAWLHIARRCPRTRFVAYTRSWAVPTIRPVLDDLAMRRNVSLWLSADRDSGLPPRIAGAGVAWLATDLREPVPALADRVLRSPGLVADEPAGRIALAQITHQKI